MTEAVETVQTPCVVFEWHGWEFKVLKNPNPSAQLHEAFVGYCRRIEVQEEATLSVSAQRTETVARAMLRKHLGRTIKRHEINKVATRVDNHMRKAIDGMRPKS